MSNPLFTYNFDLEHLRERPRVYNPEDGNLTSECRRVEAIVRDMTHNGAKFIEINTNKFMTLEDRKTLINELCRLFPGHVDVDVPETAEPDQDVTKRNYQPLLDVEKQFTDTTEWYQIRID